MNNQLIFQNMEKTEKRKYYRPDINIIKIDNDISLVMMSGASPDNDPGGHRQSDPNNKPDAHPFQNPFH